MSLGQARKDKMKSVPVNLRNGDIAYLYDIAEAVCKRLATTSPATSSQHSAEALGNSILRQLFEVKKSSGGLRLSQSGTCARQLAYQYHHAVPNGMGIDANSRIAFAIGDATEAFLVSAIAEIAEGYSDKDFSVSCIGDNQETVSLPVDIHPGYQAIVPGHPDGSMVVLGTNAILEIKSMSEYAFGKFRSKGLTREDSYYWQVQAYMAAKGYAFAYVLAYNKAGNSKEAFVGDDGVWLPAPALHGQWIEFDHDTADNIHMKFRQVLVSDSPEDIERPYGPGKKGKLTFPCDYCAYYKTCFPNSEEQADETRWLKKNTKIKVYVRDSND